MFKKFLPHIIILIFILGVFAFQYFQKTEPIQASASDNVSGYAWSDNIGWISFNNTTGGGSSFGVNVDISVGANSGKLSGYAWSDNIGWITFNEADLSGCPIGTCVAKATPSGQLGKGDVYIQGWARALSNGGGWDGWIKFDHNNPADKSKNVYIDLAGNFHGYAWGSDVVGWIYFYNVFLNLSGLNQPPDKPGIPAGYPANGVVENNCSIQALSIPTFNWTYYDSDGDPRAAYQIQIDDAFTFPTPILLDETVNQDSASYLVSYTPTSAWVSANLNWGATYYWRAKVEDNQGNWSVWSDYKSFTIPNHAYPWIDFNWLPASPKANELVQFSSASTTFYGGVDGKSWTWDFGDTGTSAAQNPSHSYLTLGTYLVKLGVCDDSNYCCTGVNAKQKSIQISLPLPEWKEVAPF